MQCYNCQELDGYASGCKNRRKERQLEANLAKKLDDDDEPLLLLAKYKPTKTFEVREKMKIIQKYGT